MDPILKPIKSVLPSGLTVITTRTEREGLIGGQIRLGVGGAHAAAMNPYWLGLPHFDEHMVLFGASKGRTTNEVKELLRREYHVVHNAYTSLTQTRHLTTSSVGLALPSRNFWPVLEVTVNGMFYPEYDLFSFERERNRILEEMGENLTSDAIANSAFMIKLFGVEYLGQSTFGTFEQVKSYTPNDARAYHEIAYNLSNLCVAMAGDVIHEREVEKLQRLLRDMPTANPISPITEQASVQTGEHRYVRNGTNEGQLEIYLHFPSSGIIGNQHYATNIAVRALSEIIEHKVMDRFGLYEARMAHENWLAPFPCITLVLKTNASKAQDVVAYALEILQSTETEQLVSEKFGDVVSGITIQAEIAQPSVEAIAEGLNTTHAIGAPLLSTHEQTEHYKRVAPEQARDIVRGINRSPMFLHLRGHADALDALPAIDVIDSWRGLPQRPAIPPTVGLQAKGLDGAK